jgi:hypothetical protein
MITFFLKVGTSLRLVRLLFVLAVLSSVLCRPSSVFAALEIQNAPATNIQRLSAAFCATLVATNGTGTNPVLTVFYDVSEPTNPTTPSAWSYSNVVGQANTGAVSTNIAGLLPAQQYYFTWQAIEGTSTAWSASTTNFFTAAGAPTSMPAIDGYFLRVDTNGNLQAPTNFFLINLALLQTAGIYGPYAAPQTLDMGTNGITLAGITRINWPEHGTNDLTEWSLYEASHTVDAGTQAVVIGGVSRTNWPVDATEVGSNNAALGIRVTALESNVTSLSTSVSALADSAPEWATYTWIESQGYNTETNFDYRYSALNHLHTGVYSPTNHTHSWTNQFSPTNHLHELDYLRRPLTVETNASTNWVVFFDGTNSAGGVKTRLAAPWAGNVTNWETIGVITSEVVVPKLSIGSNVLTRPELLNIKGESKARAQFSIDGGIMTSNQVSHVATEFSQQPLAFSGTYSNILWETTTLTNVCGTNSYAEAYMYLLGINPGQSKILRCGGWGLAIPLSATIVGIKITVEWIFGRVGLSSGPAEVRARIWNNGFTGITYSAYSPNNGFWKTNELGDDHTIGLNSLTPAEVNSPDFCVDLWLYDEKINSDTTSKARALTLTVYYTLDEYPWTIGVDSDAAFTLKNERTGEIVQRWDTNTTIDLSAHLADTNNPHQVTPTQIGASTGTPIYAETDPLFAASVASGITSADTNRWNTAASDASAATTSVAEIQAWPTNDWATSGATNIVAGNSDSYNAATRTLTWDTNAAGGGVGTITNVKSSDSSVAVIEGGGPEPDLSVTGYVQGVVAAYVPTNDPAYLNMETNSIALHPGTNMQFRLEGTNAWLDATPSNGLFYLSSTHRLAVTNSNFQLQYFGGATWSNIATFSP